MVKNTVEYNRTYYLKNKEKRKIKETVKKIKCNGKTENNQNKKYMKKQKNKRNLEKRQNQSNEV